MTVKWMHGLARLAFWRKSVVPALNPADSSSHDDYKALQSVKAESPELAGNSVAKPGWASRLKQAWRRRRGQVAGKAAEPGQTAASDPASQAEPPRRDAGTTTDEPSAPALSLFARLKNRLKRRAGAVPQETVADAPDAHPGHGRTATPPREAEPEIENDAVPVGGVRRVLAVLTNKWVWLSGAGGILLALLGAMAFMLMASIHEKEKLQADLSETQKKLEQTVAIKKGASNAALPHSTGKSGVSNVGEGEAESTVPGHDADPDVPPRRRSAVDVDDCSVSDKASVTQNLKNCIESFNRAMEQAQR